MTCPACLRAVPRDGSGMHVESTDEPGQSYVFPCHDRCAECESVIDAEGHCPCNPPFVCLGCYAVGEEECAGYCPDAAIARDREASEGERYEERLDYLEEYDNDDFSV